MFLVFKSIFLMTTCSCGSTFSNVTTTLAVMLTIYRNELISIAQRKLLANNLQKLPINGPVPLSGNSITRPSTVYVPSVLSFGRNTSNLYSSPYLETLHIYIENLYHFLSLIIKLFMLYSSFLILNCDGPHALISLTIMLRPPCVFSDTTSSPSSSGSTLGISNSGMPVFRCDRKDSTLLVIHFSNSGSFRWHISM